jgi:hypothetical protein
MIKLSTPKSKNTIAASSLKGPKKNAIVVNSRAMIQNQMSLNL